MSKITHENEYNDALLSDSKEDALEPIVLAYRLGSPNSTPMRVRLSELKSDPTLFEVHASAQSLDFDESDSLMREPEAIRPANDRVYQKIKSILMKKDIRKNINTQNISLKSLSEFDGITSINDPASQYILTLVTDQLIAEGLWRDEDKDLTMTEAFPLSQAKNESRIHQNNSFHVEASLTPEEILESDSHAAALTPFYVPSLAHPMLHNLMRSSPKDLYHQVARKMIDAHYFDDHPEQSFLHRACYFASKGVEDGEHFAVLLRAGLDQFFSHYTFEQFRLERITLRKLIRNIIDNYFAQNPAIDRHLKMNDDYDKRKNVWERFNRVWDKLTTKQRSALECVYMEQDSLTKKQAAEKFGISLDSLKDRLRPAIRRFKAEFAELEGITPKQLSRDKLRGSYAHNGLWWYQSAAWKSPLYAVDPKSSLKKEIEWKKLPRSKNLDWKTVARIKAEIFENCPVPNILDTEYFDGMKPTQMSL